jgi:hypothetical protein
MLPRAEQPGHFTHKNGHAIHVRTYVWANHWRAIALTQSRKVAAPCIV